MSQWAYHGMAMSNCNSTNRNLQRTEKMQEEPILLFCLPCHQHHGAARQWATYVSSMVSHVYCACNLHGISPSTWFATIWMHVLANTYIVDLFDQGEDVRKQTKRIALVLVCVCRIIVWHMRMRPFANIRQTFCGDGSSGFVFAFASIIFYLIFNWITTFHFKMCSALWACSNFFWGARVCSRLSVCVCVYKRIYELFVYFELYSISRIELSSQILEMHIREKEINMHHIAPQPLLWVGLQSGVCVCVCGSALFIMCWLQATTLLPHSIRFAVFAF